jgi:hypothetical protein
MKRFARRREAEVGFSQPLLRRSSLMRRDPSCCWDYDGVSQCNAVWLAKTHVLVSGDTEILQRRVLSKISNRKYDCMEGSRNIACCSPQRFRSSIFFGHLQFIEVLFAGPRDPEPQPDLTPPTSNLKPVKGLDPDAYENFTTVLRQN